MQVPVAVSARHLHISQSDLEILFGMHYQLNPLRALSQHGQFAALETVLVKTDSAEFPQVRIVGPVRKRTQLEISRTDAKKLGITPPVRISGDLLETPGIRLIGPVGELTLTEGVIIAARHLHMPTNISKQLGIIERQSVKIKLNGERPVILENVFVRVSDSFELELHIDTDDANAAGISKGDWAEIIV
jgi:putative phosphotransacetylase